MALGCAGGEEAEGLAEACGAPGRVAGSPPGRRRVLGAVAEIGGPETRFRGACASEREARGTTKGPDKEELAVLIATALIDAAVRRDCSPTANNDAGDDKDSDQARHSIGCPRSSLPARLLN